MKLVRLLFAAACISLGSGLSFAGDLPDANLTPGVTNSDVTQDTIRRTICQAGWTKTIRPKVKYTNQLKLKQIVEYGYSDKDPASYEEDHLISLQLGGHPMDPKNLWPEPYATACGARVKDVLETKLKKLVCLTQTTADKKPIPLAEAQEAIAKDWIAAYKKYVDPRGCPES